VIVKLLNMVAVLYIVIVFVCPKRSSKTVIVVFVLVSRGVVCFLVIIIVYISNGQSVC
jgi:hypothetical protein